MHIADLRRDSCGDCNLETRCPLVRLKVTRSMPHSSLNQVAGFVPPTPDRQHGIWKRNAWASYNLRTGFLQPKNQIYIIELPLQLVEALPVRQVLLAEGRHRLHKVRTV